jgi:hypothetical protein
MKTQIDCCEILLEKTKVRLAKAGGYVEGYRLHIDGQTVDLCIAAGKFLPRMCKGERKRIKKIVFHYESGC